MRMDRSLLLTFCVLSWFVGSAFSRAADGAVTTPSISELSANGFRALGNKELSGASDAADSLILSYKNDARATLIAGDLYLRSGKIKAAVTQFERYLEMVPEDKPELWQYGIALAFANQFDEGRQLFELHREANPNDVENAAWHFLCVAKLSGISEANKLILPAPGDSRVPMSQILSLLNDGDEQQVIDAVEQLPPGTRRREEAEFYGNLYLGLYADAAGNAAKAKQFIGKAAKFVPSNYMSDVARVYLAELEAKK